MFYSKKYKNNALMINNIAINRSIKKSPGIAIKQKMTTFVH